MHKCLSIIPDPIFQIGPVRQLAPARALGVSDRPNWLGCISISTTRGTDFTTRGIEFAVRGG